MFPGALCSPGSNNPSNWGNPRPAAGLQIFRTKLIRVLLSRQTFLYLIANWREQIPFLFRICLFLGMKTQPVLSWTWLAGWTCSRCSLLSSLKFPFLVFFLLSFIEDFQRIFILRIPREENKLGWGGGEGGIEETFYLFNFSILDGQHRSHNSEPSD